MTEDNFFLGNDIEVYLKTKLDNASFRYYKLDISGTPEFSRERQQEGVSVPTLPGGGNSGSFHSNYTRSFEASQLPVNFAFQTYIKPFRYDGSDGERDGNSEAHDYALEAILWQHFFSSQRDYSTNTARNLAERFADSYVAPPPKGEDPLLGDMFDLFILFRDSSASLANGYEIEDCVLNSASITVDPNNLSLISWSGLARNIEFKTDISESTFATLQGRGVVGTTNVDNYVRSKDSIFKSNGLRATVDGGEHKVHDGAFAQCISVSGDTVVFGQRWMDNPDDPDDAAFGPGTPYSYDGGAHVYCTKDNGETWELQDVLSLPVLVDDQNYNYFGNAKIAGNHLMAGGQGFSSGGVECGGVAVWERVYEKTGPKWLPQNEILIPESKREDGFFGINLGLTTTALGNNSTESQTWAIIGHPDFDHAEAAQSTSSPRAGAVEFWKFDENAGFQRKQAIYNTAPLTVSSITDANPAVVTTTANHGLVTHQQVSFTGTSDATYDDVSFTVTVTGATTFTIPAGASPGSASAGAVHKEERLGKNVDIHGNYAVASLDQEGFVVYYYDPTTDVWAEQHRETGNIYATPSSYYGKNLAVSDTYIVHGNHSWDTPQSNIGRVLVYKRSSTSWSLHQTLDLPPDRSGQTVDLAQYGFGMQVSIDSANMDKILVTAGNFYDTFIKASNTGESGNGVVHMYVPNSSAVFKHVKRIEREELNDGQSALGQTAATAQEYSPESGRFGFGLDCDGDIIAIGEPNAKAISGTNQLTYKWYNASGSGSPVSTVSFAGETKNVLKIARRHNSYVSGEDAFPRYGASFVVAGKKYYLHNNSTASDSSTSTSYATDDFRSFEVTPYILDNQNGSVLDATELAALASAGSLVHNGNVTFSEESEGVGHIYKLPKTSRNEGFPLLSASIEMAYDMQPVIYPLIGKLSRPISFTKGALNIVGNLSFYHEDNPVSGIPDVTSFLQQLQARANTATSRITNNRSDISLYLGGLKPSTSRLKLDFPNILFSEPNTSYSPIGVVGVSFVAENSNHIGASNTTSDAVTITYRSSGNPSRG